MNYALGHRVELIMGKIKIHIKTVSGKVLTFTDVEGYEILEGGFIKFIDTFNGKTKIFHAVNSEIEEVTS